MNFVPHVMEKLGNPVEVGKTTWEQPEGAVHLKRN